MEDSVDIGELRHRELYQHFSEDELKQFAAVMAVREYDDGQVIYEVGEDTPGEKRALLVILSGEVLLSTEAAAKNRVAVARTMKAGELIGLVSFINGGRHSATCVAKGALRVAVVTREDFQPLRESKPSLAVLIQYTIAKQLARDLRICNQRLMNALQKGINRDDLPKFVRP